MCFNVNYKNYKKFLQIILFVLILLTLLIMCYTYRQLYVYDCGIKQINLPGISTIISNCPLYTNTFKLVSLSNCSTKTKYIRILNYNYYEI